MKRLSLFVLAGVLVAGPAARAEDLAIVINHQGRLLDANDQPHTGPATLQVKLWPSLESTEAAWSEDYEVLLDSAGQYAIGLGDTRNDNKALTSSDVTGERWFSVSIDGVELKPRQRLGGAAYALQSAYAAEAGNAGTLAGLEANYFLPRDAFDTLRATITTENGTRVPWGVLAGIPEDFGAGLREVALAGGGLSGSGSTESPVRITACGEGQILKFQSNQWQCGADVGGGETLPFDVLAPLEQVAGSGGSAAKLQVKDGGIDTIKLANDSVDSTKLGSDAGSLGKLTGNALVSTGDGSIGVGVAAPTARLEVGDFSAEGLPGAGSVTYLKDQTTVNVGNSAPVRPGDSVQLGGLGWRTVAAVPSATTITLASGYDSGYSGTWTYRRATLRLGQITQTATGEIGIGQSVPRAPLDVTGKVNVNGNVTATSLNVNGATTLAGATTVNGNLRATSWTEYGLKVWEKGGNNGTASCRDYCKNTSSWPHHLGPASCFAARTGNGGPWHCDEPTSLATGIHCYCVN